MRVKSLLAVAAMTVAATILAGPAPSLADPGDVVVVADQSATTSVSQKSVTVTCPDGTHVYGGGGYIWNGARRVHIAATAPIDGGVNWTQWAVGGAEIRPNDYTSSWRVHGYAICGPWLPGLEYVSVESLVNSTTTRHAHLTCPGTKKLLSAGASILDQAAYVVLDDIAITSDLRSVDVWAIERESGTAFSWSVVAYGVCVNSSAVSNLNRVQQASASTVGDKTRDADCGGQQVYGIGMSQANSAGHTLLQSIIPADTDGTTTVRTDPTGAPEAWSVSTQLVCGDE
ncbi:hypothetical protein Rhe02_06040 [Rhizocola hellebori]|uniref:Secreted protein n=1 Tax=Rhizocola hellebori TaxID=1392758 RepID=A0A8J3Q317_9ACTN|nr:hypothetical protein [Rhizocola hellebori]GIH02537.1 hypothetical protein Rhe02_06040 [Rhizocola hellebori]